MAAPWEEYQQAEGPWTQYQKQSKQKPVRDPAVTAKFYADNPELAPDYQYKKPSAFGEVGRKSANILLGAPEFLVSGITGAAGTLADVATMSDPGAHDWTYIPRTSFGQNAQEQVGAVVSPLMSGLSTGYDKVAGTGPLAQTVKERGTQAAEAIGSVIGAGAVAKGAVSTAARRSAVRSAAPKPPTITELQVAKDAAYKAAENAGVAVSRSAMNRLKVELANDLKKEGIDKDLHPKSTAALKRVLQTKGQPTLSDIETLRKIANDAKGSIEKSDARLGSRIVEKIDDFVDALTDADVVSGDAAAGTAFKEARALNTRLSKAKEIEQLFSRAELNAPNFSGSGMENALRTEFRALAKNERKMRRFNAEERAAIRKVALGGPVENVLRQLGKLAPTGVVSFGMGSGAGFLMGGPAGATAVPLAGMASRAAATKMTLGNARRAEELMRRGPVK